MQMKDRAPRAPTGLMALTLSGLALASPAAAELTELHVMNAGGLYADALDKCVNDAFFDSTGIKVIQEVPGGYAKLASQAQANVEDIHFSTERATTSRICIIGTYGDIPCTLLKLQN